MNTYAMFDLSGLSILFFQLYIFVRFNLLSQIIKLGTVILNLKQSERNYSRKMQILNTIDSWHFDISKIAPYTIIEGFICSNTIDNAYQFIESVSLDLFKHIDPCHLTKDNSGNIQIIYWEKYDNLIKITFDDRRVSFNFNYLNEDKLVREQITCSIHLINSEKNILQRDTVKTFKSILNIINTKNHDQLS